MDNETMREEYARRMDAIRREFVASGDGVAVIAARSKLVDELLTRLWGDEETRDPAAAKRVAVVAVGGYGRAQLFPYSDIDVMFCVDKGDAPKEAVRRTTQALWDCGLRVSPITRAIGECDRFDTNNAEGGLALLDRRMVTGEEAVFEKLETKAIAKMMARDAKAIRAELLALTRLRHAKYGDTLFHLEPNIKDCPGGLRDAHVCEWLATLRWMGKPEGGLTGGEFGAATRFLAAVRCFLHYRHQRDDNVLDWQAQDAAAAARIGLGRAPLAAVATSPTSENPDMGHPGSRLPSIDGAYWMRAYFRNARVVERSMAWEMEAAGLALSPVPVRKLRLGPQDGFSLRDGRLELDAVLPPGIDPAEEPEIVLSLFVAISRTGAALAQDSEMRIGGAIPLLSAHLEEGPGLWRSLAAILTGEYAGAALRTMHALGLLDLILPEFHGIDALVIRDAYHRYTVDEHTFVLIDTLHGLEAPAVKGAPDWRTKFGQMARELSNPELLYMAALLHDTGKGRAGDDHAKESAQMAEAVLGRLEVDSYDAGQVVRLIEMHLEMSAALRRDIFDAETVRVFAAKVQTHEMLRMLTLLTYADIQAVHPDALTPWKAENLWRLSMSAANQMDRSVDEQRVRASGASRTDDRVDRVVALSPEKKRELEIFLEGFPERYLTTRSPEQIKLHFEMAERFDAEPMQIEFQHGPAMNEITVVTRDRPSLFAGIAGALAAWGMNVVTADGYADGQGVVVDSFRFTDTFRTLELNASERIRFVESVREIVSGRASMEAMLAGRRKSRRQKPLVEVETKIDFDESASSHSTLLQVVAQDVPGLLRAISKTLSELGYNVEVVLVDTEGETAIDVFYLTRMGVRLTVEEEDALRAALVEAIRENAS
jgi:[protein-PII] uridylyltransferase